MDCLFHVNAVKYGGAMRGILLAALGLLLSMPAASAEPVRVWRTNPHYFEYKGKPVLLITSDHHYGAVIDLDFDFSRFLDYMATNGMNLARIYPGGMFEAPDKYLPGNPLGPLPGRQILPWPRSSQPGAHPGLASAGQPSNKFDLDRWNPEYFARLKAFVAAADRKDIVVEVAFFNGQYEDCWPLNALYHGNNIQNVGQYEAAECGLFTTNDPRNQDVLRYQKAYVARIAEELNGYDNVIFDLCDEPSLHGKANGDVIHVPDGKVIPWLLALKDSFLEAEARLPKKHILGQTALSLSPDLSRENWCDWIPTEYVRPATAALDKDYSLGKPLVNVETDYYGYGLTKPYTVDDVRAEAWWYMMRGGAGCINLNGEYYRGHEAGLKDTQQFIVPQLKILRDFLYGFDLARVAAFTGVTGPPEDVTCVALAEPGRQYGIYLYHGKLGPHHFVPKPGLYRGGVTVRSVPAGVYELKWIDPATGAVKGTQKINWSGGDLTAAAPEYALDIVLRMSKN
jgi:hypothetical protein